MMPKICTKMLRNFNGKRRAKFPATKCRYSMVKIARLGDVFSESPVEGKSLPPKIRKGDERKAKKVKNRKA